MTTANDAGATTPAAAPQPAPPTPEESAQLATMELVDFLERMPARSLREAFKAYGRKPERDPGPLRRKQIDHALDRFRRESFDANVPVVELMGDELVARQQEVEAIAGAAGHLWKYRQICIAMLHLVGTPFLDDLFATARSASYEALRWIKDLEDYHGGALPKLRKGKRPLPVPAWSDRYHLRHLAAQLSGNKAMALDALRKSKGGHGKALPTTTPAKQHAQGPAAVRPAGVGRENPQSSAGRGDQRRPR